MSSRIFAGIVMMFVSLAVSAGSIKIETGSGYKTTAELHKAKGQPRGITVVMLHGKGSNPGVSHYSGFYSKLRKAGYTVVAPRMPYSKFDGDHKQTIEVINAAVDEAAQRGDRVVVAGHSMGATISLQYAGGSPRSQVIGVMPIAVGHDPSISGKIRRMTEISVEEARGLVAAGKGSEKRKFDDLNGKKISKIKMTAAIYQSYYDPMTWAGLGEVLPKIRVPVFWLSGEGDRLTAVYDAENNFELIPEHEKSRYLEASGNHKSVVSKQTGPVVEWLNTL